MVSIIQYKKHKALTMPAAKQIVFALIPILLSVFISISNYFVGPYFSSSFAARLKFLYPPRKNTNKRAALM